MDNWPYLNSQEGKCPFCNSVMEPSAIYENVLYCLECYCCAIPSEKPILKTQKTSEPAKFDVDSIITGFPIPGQYPTKKDLEYFGMVKKKKKERYRIYTLNNIYPALLEHHINNKRPFVLTKECLIFKLS
jgi:hypothetical protein